MAIKVDGPTNVSVDLNEPFKPTYQQRQEWDAFLKKLRERVSAGDPTIPIDDFTHYEAMVGPRAHLLLREQWEEAKVKRAKRELIAECTAPVNYSNHCDPTSIELAVRTNRLLAAILEKLQ